MKLADILLFEKPSINLVVLQTTDSMGNPLYRVDPNPDHTEEDFKNAWTKDLSQARVFKEKAARRFLRYREEQSRERMFSRKGVKMVPVELDAHGHPIIPGEQKEEPRPGGLFGRLRRRA